MSVSVMDATSRAFSRTQKILFQPFDLNKWLAMGFCAFLAMLGKGGGANFPSGNSFGRDHDGVEQVCEQAVDWIQANLSWVLLLGGGILLLCLALGILFQWLSSRGHFMFLDNVLKNRGAVSDPWRRYAELGNRLFYFRLCVGLVGFALVIGLIAVGAISAWPLLKAKVFGLKLLMSILVPGCLLLIVAFVVGLLERLLGDFGVPVMFKRNIGPWAALKVLFGELLPGRYLEFILLYLFMLLLGIAAAIPIVLVTCLTCCIAGLPYISSVVFLPVLVFFRCYTLCFLEQLGPEWRLWEEAPPAVVSVSAAAPAAPLPEPIPGAVPSDGGTTPEAAPGLPPREVPPPPFEPK